MLVSAAITEGVGLLGDFTGSARLMMRENVRIDTSENTASDFTANQVRFRAEMRVNLAVTRPQGFCEVDLTAA